MSKKNKNKKIKLNVHLKKKKKLSSSDLNFGNNILKTVSAALLGSGRRNVS